MIQDTSGAIVQSGVSNERYRLEMPSIPLKSHYLTGLVITTYNHPLYLARCLQSIKQSKLNDAILMIVDDGSDDQQTLELIESFTVTACPVIKAYRVTEPACNIHKNLAFGWDFLQQFQCRYLTNLDPDTIVRTDWLNRLQNVYEQATSEQKLVILTGFNAQQHPVIEIENNYYRKASVGGLNLFFHSSVYAEIVRPTFSDLRWDMHLVAAMEAEALVFHCTRPSVIQHIGRDGLWSGPHGVFDFAIDYWGTNPWLMRVAYWYLYGRRRLALYRYRLRLRYLNGQAFHPPPVVLKSEGDEY